MAEDQDESQKTEEPTQKRLEDARKKGDVAKSQEVTTLFMLTAGAIGIAVLAGPMAGFLNTSLTMFFEKPHALPTGAEGLRGLFADIVWLFVLVMAVPFALFVIAAVVGNLIQAPFVFTAERMKPDINKLNPIKGLQKMFGLQGLTNFAKGLAKLIIVGAVTTAVVWPQRNSLLNIATLEPAQLLPLIQTLAIQIMIAVIIVLIAIAALDFAYQRYEWIKRLKMTKQEVKDEYKQMEGDPHVKAKIRQLRQERSSRRMMAAVPDATVVITNPTHFAVALSYESGTMAAPVCVAKGVDAIALRIRETAKEHKVPIVENPPLARALYATVELDDPVPEEHFKAVAQVIGYVWRLRGKRAR